MTEKELIISIIKEALAEDLGTGGDHTSKSTIPEQTQGKAQLLIKESGIISGIEVAQLVFQLLDPEIRFTPFLADGDKIKPGNIAFKVEGNVISILSGERLALNFLQRMSGIATQTSEMVEIIGDLECKLLDTRKTTPNMRIFEKMAVRAGGGYNHRFGLFDMILIKDNHVDFAGGVALAISKAIEYQKKNGLSIPIEIEVRDFNELEEALRTGGFQRIMLDNFTTEDMQKAVQIIDGRFETEASGGITKDTLRKYAETGIDFISVGALTHQIKSLDMSLRAIT